MGQIGVKALIDTPGALKETPNTVHMTMMGMPQILSSDSGSLSQSLSHLLSSERNDRLAAGSLAALLTSWFLLARLPSLPAISTSLAPLPSGLYILY